MSCTASAIALCRPLVFCILYVNVYAHLNFLFVLLKQVLMDFCLFFSKNNVLLPAKCQNVFFSASQLVKYLPFIPLLKQMSNIISGHVINCLWI